MKSVHKRIGIGIGICAIASLLGSNVAMAAHEEGHPAQPIEAQSVWKSLGFQISGTVLASYTQNFGNPNTNNNQMRIFDTAANSFMANMAQVVFQREANASGSGADRVGFRARINFGTDARFSRARTNFQPGTENTELDVQELYAEYIAPVGNGLKVQFGKINTLIGYEVINAWENPNFSRTMMFGLSQAFTTTGVRFTYPFSKWATASIGLVNGWDNIEDNNRGKTFEYLAAFTPHEKFGISFFGSYGPEQPNGNATNFAQASSATAGACVTGQPGCDPTAKRTVAGAIITIKPTAMDTVILEPYYANEGNVSGYTANSIPAGTPGNIGINPANSNGSHNGRWNGFVTYYIHDFNDQQMPNAFSARLRGEIWEDAGGSRACAGNPNFAGGANSCAGTPNAGGIQPAIGAQPIGTPQTAWETTYTLQWKPVPALQTRVEYRYDHSNKNNFLHGNQATNNQSTLGFSVAYMW